MVDEEFSCMAVDNFLIKRLKFFKNVTPLFKFRKLWIAINGSLM